MDDTPKGSRMNHQKALKPRKCKHCREPYTPSKPMQTACSIPCALALAQKAKEKAQAVKAKEERKEKLKKRSDYIKDAQVAANAFIRYRDKDKPCICCGKPLGSGDVGGAYDCGHYRSIGSAPHLRFDQRNMHAQRKICNRWGAGRAVDYRLGLIERIGLAEVEALEADQEPRKWTIDELIAIRDHYRKALRELKNSAT